MTIKEKIDSYVIYFQIFVLISACYFKQLLYAYIELLLNASVIICISMINHDKVFGVNVDLIGNAEAT